MAIEKPVYFLSEDALSPANGQGIKPSIHFARLETLGHSIVQNANCDAPSNVHSKWRVPAEGPAKHLTKASPASKGLPPNLVMVRATNPLTVARNPALADQSIDEVHICKERFEARIYQYRPEP
tara:strand:+ start:267 stop:638 length:372 start_codon:yes stop_codon:yes gene_type:complete